MGGYIFAGSPAAPDRPSPIAVQGSVVEIIYTSHSSSTVRLTSNQSYQGLPFVARGVLVTDERVIPRRGVQPRGHRLQNVAAITMAKQGEWLPAYICGARTVAAQTQA